MRARQLFLQASVVKSRDRAVVSSEPFVRTLRMTRYVYADRVYVWHVFMTYENVSTLVRTVTTINSTAAVASLLPRNVYS